jgi:hypothetical protein
MRGIVGWSVAALLALTPAASFAQAKPAAPVRVQFRAMTEEGQMVSDLKPADLSLKVNGKIRPIQSLTEFHANRETAASGSTLPPPYSSNVAAESGRILHVLIDDYSISPGREAPVKDAIRLMMAELSPVDQIGLLSTAGTINLRPTSDVTKVKLAADSFVGRAGATETDSDTKCRTKQVLAAVGTMLSLAGQAPTTIAVFSSGLSTPETKKVVLGGRGTSSTSEVCPVEPDDFSNIGALAAVANADMYMFHVTEGLAARSSTLDAGFESLAGVTGGEFIRLTGNAQPGVSKLLRDTAVYYVATFEPEPGERNGQTVRLELKPLRDKVKVRAHPSLLMPKEVAAKAVAPKDMLRVGAEYRDLPLRAASFASRMEGRTDVRVVALFEPIDPASALTAAAVGLFDAKGTLKAQWTAQKDDLARTPARADLLAPPGVYRVRVAATDAAGRGGTTDYELNADMVRADPLKLSALVLGTPGPGGGALAPRLEFTAERVAVGLLEIYGVPKGAAVKVDLDVAQTLEGPALATAETNVSPGSAEDMLRAYGGFAIDTLAPGDYVMRAVVLLDGKPVGKVTRTLRKAGK